MKRSFFKKTAFCVIAILLLVAFVLVACSKKDKLVAVPTGLSIQNDVLTWEAVPGTLTYDVKVDEDVYSTQETRFPLPISDYAFHTYTVRANTHDGTSEYATALTYARRAATTVLPALSAPVISMTSNRVMWGTVLNNNGYKIYMGDNVYTVGKNETYYDIAFPADGIYYIRMQTLGDGLSYNSSVLSNAYAVTVKDGKAPLQKLPKTEFTFDAATKSLVWTNRYSAAAVDYEIYQEGVALPIATIRADATKVKMSYAPVLNGGQVAYTMRLVSNNGMYNPSDFNTKIKFPIADAAPTSLAVALNDEASGYEISWNAVTYCDGYVVEMDGEPCDATTDLSMPLPEGLAAGRHVVRVKTRGLGVYYADSLFGEGVVFYLNDAGGITAPLATPSVPVLRLSEENVLSVVIQSVKGASRYRMTFVGASGENTLLTESEVTDLSEGRFGNRNATEAENAVIKKIFADLPTGIRVSVVALPSDSIYVESARSSEAFLSSDAEVAFTIAPDLLYGADGLEWSNIGEDLLFEVLLDGVLYDTADLPALSGGTHRARVRAKATNALWSNEIFFRSPIDLDVPTDLKLTGSVLSFGKSKHATGYRLYVDEAAVATITPSEEKINLSNYITKDGEYVVYLIATSSVAVFTDSAPSRQILYVKDDAPYGTQVKPYYPADAAALWTGLGADPTAYFRLSAGGVYDFTNYDFSVTPAFTFKGTLMGNGATLSGIRVGSPLFAALENATIRDLKIRIEAADFTFSQNGVLAKTIMNTTISGVEFTISARASLTTEVSFGALCYEATEFTMRDSSVVCDLSLLTTMKNTFAAVGNNVEGSLTNVTLSGNVNLGGKDVRCGVLSVTGAVQLSDFNSSVSLIVNATDNATIAGVSLEGSVTGTRVTTNNTVDANGAYAFYYGVSTEGVTLSNGAIGGNISAKGSIVKMYGASEKAALSLTDVTVTSQLKGKATDQLSVAGIADTIPNDAVLKGLSFVGAIEGNAPRNTLAGIAFTAESAYSARTAGTITATGKEARVTAGTDAAAGADLVIGGNIVLNKVENATVGGAAMTASGETTISGSLGVTATECGEVRFGGAVASGDQTVEIGTYAISGNLAADLVRFGGVSYEGGTVSFFSEGLAVNVYISSEDIKAAGAYLSASSFAFSAPSSVSATITGVGAGEIGGFGCDVGSTKFSDLTVSGHLSLDGSGTLYGVANNTGDAENVDSSVSMSANGAVGVYGLFRSIASAKDLTLRDATIDVLSDNAVYYGVVRTVRDGVISGATISDVSFEASPASTEDSTILLYGLTEYAKTIEKVSVSSVTYRIGDYGDLSFAGLANELNGDIRSSSLAYELYSSAADATIGGAFRSAKGTLSVDLGSGNAPLKINAKGRATVGGLVLEPQDLSLSNGSASIAMTLDLVADGENAAGGLFAQIDSVRTVTISDYTTTVSLSRSGEGALTFGGAAATCNGTLVGAKVELNGQDGGSEDLFGGVVGKLEAGRLGNASARGTLSSAGSVGGLVGDAAYGHLDGGASSVKITSSGKAGGVFAVGLGTRVQNVCSISRLTNKGAGLFWEGENLIVTNAYFAGQSSEYALAGKATNCTSSGLLLDSTLSSIPAVGTGSLDHEIRTLGYGYTGVELGSAFTADGKRYPFVKAVGPFAENGTLTTRSLSAINITETTDLYSVLPRFYDANTPTITWIDAGATLSIENGVATVNDNGAGTLYGLLSGGVRVYSVYYTASGFVPLVGEGTAESPYLIRDIRYFHYVKEYSETFATAHFRLDLEENTVEDAEFTALFTESVPFRGTMDFNGVTFLSPTFPEAGILGYLNGATVKGLRLGGNLGGTLLAAASHNATIEDVEITDAYLAGETVLVGAMTDSHLSEATIVGQAFSATDFALIGAMTDSVLEDVSLFLSLSGAGAASACLIGNATDSEITQAQALFRVSVSDALSVCLVRVDVGSVYTNCMSLIEVRAADAEQSVVTGLALQADGTSFVNVAVVIDASDLAVSPLIGEGTATYTNVVLSASLDEPAPAGVTLATIANARTLIGALTGYVAGALPTPLGYDRFGESNETAFTLTNSEATISDRVTIRSLTSMIGEKPFSTLVSYSFTGDCAAVEGESLRPKKNGLGVLTLTNLYGVSRTIEVTVEDFDGFAEGSGTEEDPYLVDNADEFIRMFAQEDYSYYFLTRDLAIEITESVTFSGVLTSAHRTVEITLTADTFLDSCGGRIEAVDFVIAKDAVTAEEIGGLFAREMTFLIMRDCEITIDCPSVTLEDGATFGYLAGSVNNGGLYDCVVSVAASDVAAGEGATVGVLFGSAENTTLNNVTAGGSVSLVGAGEVLFGSIGNLSASSETILDYDEYDNEHVSYYVDTFALDLTISVTADTVKAGGLAGQSGVAIKGVSGTVDLTVDGGEIKVGGVAGASVSKVMNVDLASTITSSDTVIGGYVGGIVGYADDEVADGVVTATITVSAQGELYAGGAVGYGESLADLRVTADVYTQSEGRESVVKSLRNPESEYVILLAAGGAAGCITNTVSRVSVTVTRVRAESEYALTDLCVLAAGAVGKLSYAEDVEVKGAGAISATGGRTLVAGVAALLGDGLDRVVAQEVTLTGSAVGGAVGEFYREDGRIADLFCALSGLADDTPAIVRVLTEGSAVTRARYLTGKPIGTGDAESLTDVAKLGTLASFNTASQYAEFDGEIWNVAGDAIPSLR